MRQSIVRVVTSKPKLRTSIKKFLKSPLSDSMIAAFIVGIFLLSFSGTMHPVATSVLSQESNYYVTENVTHQPAFALFPHKVTYLKFQMPQNEEVNYSLVALVEEHVTVSLANPGGIKLVLKNFLNGTAKDGTVTEVKSMDLSFALETYMNVNSLTQGSYNFSIESYAYYNTTLSFSPAFAITGLALSIVSVTVLASFAGMKVEET